MYASMSRSEAKHVAAMLYPLRVSYTLAENACAPTKAHEDDAGWDLYASEDVVIPAEETRLVPTGLTMAIDPGWCGIVKERSGLALKSWIHVHGGVIDAGYRDVVGVIMENTGYQDFTVSVGSRIAQMLFVQVPHVTWIKVDSLGTTRRGGGGFGSTGS